MHKRNLDNWFKKMTAFRHISRINEKSPEQEVIPTTKALNQRASLDLKPDITSRMLWVWLIVIWCLWGLMIWGFYTFQNSVGNRQSIGGWLGLVICSTISFVLIYYINLKLIQHKTIQIGKRLNIEFKNQQVIGRFFKLDYAILDKTGTLTEPAARVREIVLADPKTRSTIFSILESLEQQSKHPVARGIIMYLQTQKFQRVDLQLVQSRKIEAGIWGRFVEDEYALLSRAAVRQLGIEPTVKADGMMMCYLVQAQQKIVASIVLEEQIRQSAPGLIQQFRNQRVVTVMATGDNDSNANRIGQVLEIDVIAADLTSHSKGDLVKAYQQNGRVLFVGDGDNDYLALQLADFSIGLMHNKQQTLGAMTDVQIQADHLSLVQASLELMQQALIKKWLSLCSWGVYWGMMIYAIQQLDVSGMNLSIIYIGLGLLIGSFQVINFKLWKTRV
ncbi:HAD-IC family P-type ATPase [Weissella coleopterorum]|uniref:P-type Cu(+) transporter n=1 Tax=Weissella coleopterorum TaxID=2714949 RepID=A0A6G8B1E7_9LACO|nr:HAD-IC family P-type ATPase [Weissella coleopterorum]QIL51060.1 HAD-IC family P-type ATPase [Weissella coleopterorum]